MILTQEHYPHIEVDVNEPDIVVFWQYGERESNVLHIEREKLNELINFLIGERR